MNVSFLSFYPESYLSERDNHSVVFNVPGVC